MINLSPSPGPWKKAALLVLALLVFALATYARLSWYGEETLEKRYLVKSVKLQEARAKIVVDDLSGAAPVFIPPLEPPLPAPSPVAADAPVILLANATFQPAYFRPPPSLA